MSWYDADWPYRAAITIEASGKGSSPIDAQIVLPADFPLFWDNVLSSGADIRVTDADGITLETYALSGFNKTNKTGTIQIESMGITTSRANVVWLYWGNASASSAAGSVSLSSPADGYVAQDEPGALVVRAGPEQPGATLPQTRIPKQPSPDSIFVYFDVSDLLIKRRDPYEGHIEYDEVKSAIYAVNSGGAGQAGMIDATLTRVIEYGGRTYVRVLLKSGTDGTDYQVLLTAETTLGQTRVATALLQVRNTDEG